MEGDGAGGGGELEGVVEEVEKELADREGIEGGFEASGEVDVGDEGVFLLLEVGLDEFECFGEEGLQVGGLEVVEFAAFSMREKSRMFSTRFPRRWLSLEMSWWYWSDFS